MKPTFSISEPELTDGDDGDDDDDMMMMMFLCPFLFFKERAAMELGATKTIILAGGVLVLPVLAFITSFLFWPGALLKAYNW